MQYIEKVIQAEFNIDYMREPVLFRIDGKQRRVSQGMIEITADGVVITLLTGDARMIIRQTAEGWQVTEDLLVPSETARIHIGGNINASNLNLGGTQVINNTTIGASKIDLSKVGR